MGAPIAHVEFASSDPARSGAFYRDLFGWTLNEGPGDYTLIDTGAGQTAVGGGVGDARASGLPTGITVYVKVDDVRATLERANELGGSTALEPTSLAGDAGEIALLRDPDGTTLGLWS